MDRYADRLDSVADQRRRPSAADQVGKAKIRPDDAEDTQDAS
jgi:hypothetical protein